MTDKISVEGLGEATIKCTCLGPGHADRCKIKTLRTECTALKQRVGVLEEALKPFADFARQLPMAGKFYNDSTVYQYDDSNFTVGDLKRASKALAPHAGEKDKSR